MHWFARLHIRFLAPMFRAPVDDAKDGDGHGQQENHARKTSQDLDGVELATIGDEFREEGEFLSVPGTGAGDARMSVPEDEELGAQPHWI
eukprot:TRINITY_DN4811_c0_g1_i2.p1 TRINITY_DN4811_c0_g1~~TRINITY_DN4811_c0_g1_i2.p1  ORF type:complete len:90 (-),score=25.39 TRINITY_DN4811_c0_g1_i2:366-635(-)